jgi:hypothetical protein
MTRLLFSVRDGRWQYSTRGEVFLGNGFARDECRVQIVKILHPLADQIALCLPLLEASQERPKNLFADILHVAELRCIDLLSAVHVPASQVIESAQLLFCRQ